MHLRAIADLLEQEEGKQTATSPIEKPSNRCNVAAVFNVAKRYKVSCDMIRMVAESAGITPVIKKDSSNKNREYYRYEDIPTLDKELRKLTKYNGKPYRTIQV